MREVIQNDETSMRNKDNMNAWYIMCHMRFIKNAYNALWKENTIKEKRLVINKII